MDPRTLVNLDVNEGLSILAALDTEKITVVAALWMVSPDDEEWQLVLSSPSLDQSHPLRAYEKVAEALHKHSMYMRPPIVILPTENSFIRDLRSTFGKAKRVDGMRLGGQTIGNRFISDAYVYRVQ